MDGWETILIWTFKGKRFEDHGVELRDLAALASLRDAIVESAKQIWRIENPGKNLPAHFENGIVLKVFGIEQGSAKLKIKAPVDDYEHDSTAQERPSEPEEERYSPPKRAPSKRHRPYIRRACARVVDFADYVVGGKAPPSELSPDELKCLKNTFSVEHGETDDQYELEVPPEPPPQPESVNKTERQQLRLLVESNTPTVTPRKVVVAHQEKSHLDDIIQQIPMAVPSNDNAALDNPIDIVGEIVAADVKKSEAKITIDDRQIRITFTADQEERFTKALHEHNKLRVRIVGRGTYDSKGTKLARITAVDDVQIVNVAEQMKFGWADEATDAGKPTTHPTADTQNATMQDQSIMSPSWDGPCEAMFEYLAQNDPAKLLAMIEEGSLRPGHLTHAAEAVGLIGDAATVVPILIRLLEHKSPLVREGALYGLAAYPTDAVIERIKLVAATDPIEEVQAAARSVLEGI